ncbi:predicted protein [Postia placenta Mad-698-R]|nr:predicted protein [Postia placenta Mad-698-R]
MATFTQADIDQRIAVTLAAYQSQQSTAKRPLRLDIPAPEPFSGKAEDLRHFIQCVLSYFVATNNTRLSDEAKIAFMVALMRKDLGKTWADAYYEKSAGGVQVYPDWAAFATALEEAFPEHGTRIKAHQILMKLPKRQKNKKMALSLRNYPGTTKSETPTPPNKGPSPSQTPGTMASQWILTPLQSWQPLPPHREEGSGN